MKGKTLNSSDLVKSYSKTFIRGALLQQWNNAKFVKIYGFHFKMTRAECLPPCLKKLCTAQCPGRPCIC